MNLNDLDKKKEFLENIKNNFQGRFIHEEVISTMFLIDLLQKRKKQINYLELGVHNGASFCCAIYNSPNVSCYGIDLFQNTSNPTVKNKAGYTLDIVRTEKNIQSNNRFNNKYKLFAGDLNSINSKKFAEDIGGVDLLFIDAGHSYRDVKLDFENYSPLVNSGGYIAFDDYAIPSTTHPGVVKFCDSIETDLYNIQGYVNITGDKKNGTFIIQKK